MRTLTKTQLAVPLLALALALLLVLVISLAPGSTAEAIGDHHDHGDTSEFVVTAFAPGPATFTDNVSANFRVRYDRGRALNSNLPRDASNVLMVEATWDEGATSGWHTHPGPGVIIVVDGEVTVTNAIDCIPRRYGPGEAFLDPGQGNVHIATNESTTKKASAIATFFGVPDGEPATIPEDPADC